MPIYQISGWDRNFENSRSREIEHPAFVIMPNKQHGMGFQRILGQPEGVAMFGLWVLILQACSRQRHNQSQQRDGWLTDDGKAAGVPWDAEDLALRWKQPVDFCQRALDLFSHPKVGWLRRHETVPSADKVPTVCRSSADQQAAGSHDGADRTEQNRTENRTEGNGAVAAAVPPHATTTTTPGKRFKVVSIDTAAARRAIDADDLIGLIRAYGGNAKADRHAEWAREADGLTLPTVGTILDWQYQAKTQIREPSGLRIARAKWRDELTGEYRRQLGTEFLRAVGINAQVRTPVPAASL